MAVGSALPPRWTKKFPNGADDLANPPEFIIADPDMAELEKLFSISDPRSEDAGAGEES